MILTRKALPRRSFLRGMGATLGLPLLDAMIPARTALAATAAAPVRRLGFVYIPMGATIGRWNSVRHRPHYGAFAFAKFADSVPRSPDGGAGVGIVLPRQESRGHQDVQALTSSLILAGFFALYCREGAAKYPRGRDQSERAPSDTMSLQKRSQASRWLSEKATVGNRQSGLQTF